MVMKELSIEQKAKAYDEALKRVKEVYQRGYYISGDIERIFPELKESEDEKIRKELIAFIKRRDRSGCDYDYDHWIAWLEKQSEPTEINPSEFDSQLNRLLKQFQSLPKEELASSLSFYLNVVHNDSTYKEEKQGEQKSFDYEHATITQKDFAPKQEPKFHEGDWVIDNQGIVHQIANIIENVTNHTWGYDVVGGGYFNDKSDVRLWTIQDARDGDVLVNGSNIFIFHFIYDTRLMGYCHVNTNDGRFYIDIGKNECLCLIDAVVTPTTKEQCELLFQKMKDAGYEWDGIKFT